MQKEKKWFLAVVVIVVVAAVSSIVTYAVTKHKMNTGEIYLKNDSYAELMQYYELKNVREILAEHYAEEISDARQETLVQGAVGGMMRALGDGYSAFYTAEEYDAYFDEQLDGSFIAQGMLLEWNESTGYPVVRQVFADTAAYEAGISAGDTILSVEGKSTYGKEIGITLGYIRGVEGTSVTLRLKRGAQEKEQTLVRTEAAVQVVYTGTATDKAGYIRIVEFTGNCAEELAEALRSMQDEKAEALVLDLRGVRGGYIREAAEAANLLLDKGQIATSVRQGQEGMRWESDAEVESTLPIVVLTDGATSGVAEVFAAALQDRGRAQVAGQTTRGQAASTAIFKVPSTGSMVKLVTAYYVSPNGRQIQGQGVAPDVALELGDGSAEAEAALLAEAAALVLSE